MMEHTTIHHAPQGFVWKYVFSQDHKTIGLQYLFTSLFFMVVGGLLAMMMRWQLAWPGKPLPLGAHLPDTMAPGGVMLPEFYNTLFTMHGTIMIFFVVIALLIGAFGNFVVPLQIGARDMAFPFLNMISYWVFFVSGVVAVISFFVPGGAAAAGWTSYAPLSAIQPVGQTYWIISVIILGASSLMGAVNYITTIINLRAKGMSFFRLPMTTWAVFITAIIVLLATPVLTGAVILLLLDRTLSTSFFLPAGMIVDGTPLAHSGGYAVLWQHLFWFYSHPAVYIMILPAMGMVSDILSAFSRKPLFGYRSMVYAIIAIALLGFLVWAHHMFVSGMNPTLGTTFMLSTMVIAVPSAIKTFNWLGTLWRGSIRFTAAMLNAIAFVSMFVIGGLTGIFAASTPVDIYLHDTYFIVGHLHYVLFGGSLFGIFAGIYYWYPKMFGRMMNERLGQLHFVLTFIAYNCVFFPMFILGIGGMQRRIYDPTQYALLRPMQPINVFITISAFVLFAAQMVFVINFIGSWIKGKQAPANPWQANTLEWVAPSPPPHGNFPVEPTVYHGPYEYSRPDLSQDWLPQNQPLPASAHRS